MVEKRVHDLSEYGYVALDEAHYIKNLTAKRTIAIHALLQDYTPEFYTYATGTPITNRIPEIYSFLVSMAYHSHVKPNILDRYPTHYQFCQRFCNVTESRFGGRSVMQYSGVKNLDELRSYLRPWTICRDYSQVEGMETQVIRANYKDDPELDKAWQAFAVAREINPTAKRDSAVAKAHFTAEYCKNELLSGNVPLVVFSDHPDAVFAIERELGADYRVKSIVGGIPMGERHATVEAFQRGLLDAIVLSTGSSSTGITLTRASTVVFNDIPWTPEDLHQARKRVDRIGQTKRTRCVYVVGSKVDDHIVKTVEGKSKVIKQLAKEYGDGETTGDDHLLE
jgi:SWI/SNF-related matrix-associated actin-dependent regulator 1 of chromatin subfamily A